MKVILTDGVTESYTYDSEGRLLTVTDALGSTVTYKYDSYGRVQSVTDAVGVCTEYEYDIAGNITKNLLNGEEYVYNVYGALPIRMRKETPRHIPTMVRATLPRLRMR